LKARRTGKGATANRHDRKEGKPTKFGKKKATPPPHKGAHTGGKQKPERRGTGERKRDPAGVGVWIKSPRVYVWASAAGSPTCTGCLERGGNGRLRGEPTLELPTRTVLGAAEESAAGGRTIGGVGCDLGKHDGTRKRKKVKGGRVRR